jgi:chorismate mutase / prephenate dehydratase
MTKDSNQNQLLQLRKSIDEIDNQIINLLNQRMQVVSDVKDYKNSINETFFIKSAREADMIKNLLLKADKSIPQSTIVNIWRKIITSSNDFEQKLNITIHNPNQIADYKYLVKEYYGDFVPLTFHDSVNNVVGDIESGKAQIGIFALPDDKHQNEHWWINLANNQSGIKIFAKIPFIGESLHQLVAVAKKEPEQSDNDCTLLSIELDKEFSRYQLEEALEKVGWKFKILHSVKINQIANINFYLVELDGFFIEKSTQISNFSQSNIKPFAKVLGHFAKPIVKV